MAVALFALLGYGALRRAQREHVSSPSAAPESQRAASERVSAAQGGPPAIVEPEAVPEPIPAATPQPTLAAEAPPPVDSSSPPRPQAPATRASAAPVAAPSPTPEQVHAALVATPIVMFTASWCSVCRRAHAFLRANGLSCVDRDIDADPAALRELKQRSGSASVPTFEVDGELQRPGFSESGLERALARSVERRLGVSGIAIQR